MKKTIIGAIHFPPMPGYPEYPGFEVALSNAISDLKAFEDGGVDEIIIENNYDIPHKEKIDEKVIKEMTSLGLALKNLTKLPIGVSVLWNDYTSAFRIAKAIGGTFIRIPVFVDAVETSYGIMEGNPAEVLKTRGALDCEDIKIYADIHVKHATLLSGLSLEESAMEAIRNHADALIITGKWTGDMPDADELKRVHTAVGNFPIICGSGVNCNNIKSLFKYADGAIVSTSLKKGAPQESEVNVKPYEARIDTEKVSELVKTLSRD